MYFQHLNIVSALVILSLSFVAYAEPLPEELQVLQQKVEELEKYNAYLYEKIQNLEIIEQRQKQTIAELKQQLTDTQTSYTQNIDVCTAKANKLTKTKQALQKNIDTCTQRLQQKRKTEVVQLEREQKQLQDLQAKRGEVSKRLSNLQRNVEKAQDTISQLRQQNKLETEKLNNAHAELKRVRQQVAEEKDSLSVDIQTRQNILAITEPKVLNFIQNFFNAVADLDIESTVSFYAPQVEQYFNETWVNRDFIRKDKRYYFKRWPSISNHLTGNINLYSTGQANTKRVEFYSEFNVYSSARNKGVSGHALNTWVLRNVNGRLEIIKETQEVLSRRKY